MFLISGLLRSHDQNKFEVFLYSYGDNKHDQLHTELKNSGSNFYDVTDLGDVEIAELAISHELHVAIDLKGYTQKGRTTIFKTRIAPLHINYLGYPGTLGSDCFDYIIADKTVIPEKYRAFYTEKIIYLPDCYQPNDNRRIVSSRQSKRNEFGLPENGFVFCCFNANYKISSKEFCIWMRILKRVPGSVLWLLKSNKWAEENLRAFAANSNIDDSRLIFADKVSNAEHLERHRHVDLFLDTFNVNAHTTASDALWTCTPIITKIGKQFAARVSASLLCCLGMNELVCNDEKEYEELAVKLAKNPTDLQNIKHELTNKVRNSSLFDTDTYTSNFEEGIELALSSIIEKKSSSDVWVLKHE
jgi:predicted O-linked N-acetylglucosamine transferase (SPINDLY family)